MVLINKYKIIKITRPQHPQPQHLNKNVEERERKNKTKKFLVKLAFQK